MQETADWHQNITWLDVFDLYNYFVKIWAKLVEWLRRNQRNTETETKNLPSVMIGKKSRRPVLGLELLSNKLYRVFLLTLLLAKYINQQFLDAGLEFRNLI